MHQINDKQYEQFTPTERVRLTFAALARNDETEANRLWETCPCYRYKMRDLEYAERVNAIILIESVFFKKCVRYYNLIKKVEMFISNYHYDLEHEEQAGLNELAEKTRKLIEKAEHTRILGIVKLKSLYDGFIRFCNKVEINYNDILKSLSIEEVCHDIDLILANTVSADGTDISHVFEMFLSYWHF